MQMVVALKLIFGRVLLMLPKRIQGIWLQLANWHMPDKKLRQDIASCLFIAGDVLNRLFTIDEDGGNDDSEEVPVENEGRPARGRRSHSRPARRRGTRRNR